MVEYFTNSFIFFSLDSLFFNRSHVDIVSQCSDSAFIVISWLPFYCSPLNHEFPTQTSEVSVLLLFVCASVPLGGTWKHSEINDMRHHRSATLWWRSFSIFHFLMCRLHTMLVAQHSTSPMSEMKFLPLWWIYVKTEAIWNSFVKICAWWWSTWATTRRSLSMLF